MLIAATVDEARDCVMIEIKLAIEILSKEEGLGLGPSHRDFDTARRDLTMNDVTVNLLVNREKPKSHRSTHKRC